MAETVFVDEFTSGILDPRGPMLGPVRSGGHIIANTSPCCWGPMITPRIKGGHEPTRPVAVAGAEIGDAILIRIKDIVVTSSAAASGVDEVVEGRSAGHPSLLAKCPGCGKVRPETTTRGIGLSAIRCAECGSEASPFRVVHGYTMVFDERKQFGVTLPDDASRIVAAHALEHAALPQKSQSHSFLIVAPSDLARVATRLRPFIGNLGTAPSIEITASYNAGDTVQYIVNASHEYGVDESVRQNLTHGHMDCDAVRAGAVLICPVKVPGGGVYLADMHAMQGDGEAARHTTDVSGIITLQLEVIKGLCLEGPIIFPLAEDLPPLARPLTAEERRQVQLLAKSWGIDRVEVSAPISIIGTGITLNGATTNGLHRAAVLLGMTVEEVRNRATITGGVEIARAPGVVQITFLAPLDRLHALGIGRYAREQYGIED